MTPIHIFMVICFIVAIFLMGVWTGSIRAIKILQKDENIPKRGASNEH